METRPTLDPDFKVKATRPGWKAAVAFLSFIFGFAVFLTTVEA